MKILKKIGRAFRNPSKAYFYLRLRLAQVLGVPRFLKRRLRCANARIYINPEDRGISRDLYLLGIRESHATWTFKKHLSPGQTILDIGANLGYYVMIEADAVGPEGRIYAVEPEPRNLELLKKNVALNDWEGIVQADWGAVSDRKGTAVLHVAEQSNLHTLTRTPSMKGYVNFAEEVEVPTFTLDEYAREKGINPADIDIIRMDIEGHEAVALEGMSEILGVAKSLLFFVEVHPRQIRESRGDDGYRRFLDQLSSYGFTVAYAAESVSSRVDRAMSVSTIQDLFDRERAVELFLVKGS